MIVVTFKAKDRKPAIAPKVNGLPFLVFPKAPESIPTLIRDHIRLKHSDVLFVEPGGKVHLSPDLLKEPGFDVAAHVYRPSSAAPTAPGRFDGIGHIIPRTIFFKNSPAALRVLDRWIDRDRVSPKIGAENLIYALRDIEEAQFLHLPPAYSWIEHEMRPFFPEIKPVIEYDMPMVWTSKMVEKIQVVGPGNALESKKPTSQKSSGPRPPEVVWAGHLYDYSGYGKMNRETIFRVANTVNIRLDTSHQEPINVDEYLRKRLDAMKETLVGPKAPILRAFGPDFQADKNRYRICWTMMETYRAHIDMVHRMNDGFDEIWTPTEWNRQVFVDSGVHVKTRAVPLGVNSLIYKIKPRQKMPPCRLLSTSKAGLVAAPDGFIFLSLGLPSFRKGFDVIADAMEQVFTKNQNVHFVIALTHSLPDWNQKVYQQFAKYKTKIWALEGKFNEHELSKIYSAADCYVSASRGEGWNLPVCEASACGLPIICPDNTSHPEVVGKHAFVFPAEKPARCPEVEKVSGWYEKMPFSVLGKKSVKALAEIMETVHKGDPSVRSKATALRNRMISELSWEKTAEMVAFRLLEVQP